MTHEDTMRKFSTMTAASAALLPLLATAAAAATPNLAGTDTLAQIKTIPEGTVITPSSGLSTGTNAHTNVKIFVPAGARTLFSAPFGNYETPASLACVYGLTARVIGCNPQTLTTVAATGSRVIAIVDAFDDPTAASDLAVYSKTFGLPAITASNFEIVYASGSKPNEDSSGGWEVEESLDIQMAHALAPNAKVVLVEAASNSEADLIRAERVAVKLVEDAGGGEVSNSWASGEFSDEASEERAFEGHRVVVFASSGDSNGTGAPAALPNVVAVGGTSINRRASGKFIGQTTWAEDGGGLSQFIPTPSYQSGVTAVVGTHRGIPDIAAVANPSTGVWVYDTTPYGGQVLGWAVLGGTSVASPASAAMVNSAGRFNVSTAVELAEMYANLGDGRAFTDIVTGACGNAPSGTASVGYDLCTGIGAPYRSRGK
jgi:subtilase family serine protease